MPAPANGPAAGLDPESAILVDCGGVTLDREREERVRGSLRTGVDWDRLLALAQAHGTFPLLFHHLHTAFPGAAPRAVMDRLRSQVHALAWRNLILEKELVQLLDRLQSHGIPVVPFKGPVLAALAYGNLALRAFSDFDILAREADVLKAKDFLVADGYRLEPELTDAEAAALLQIERDHHFTLVREGSQVPVELHWRVMQRCYAFPLDDEGLWDRLGWVALGGARVPSFATEDTLLLLCAHGAKHAWSRLCLVSDLDALIRARPPLDWGTVLDRAGVLHSRRLLAVGLLLARDLLGTPLPREVAAWVGGDPTAARLAREVGEPMRHEPDDLPAREVEDRGAFSVRARERLADRIAICVGLEGIPAGVGRDALPLTARATVHLTIALRPNPRDREALRLPGWLSGLYYLIRPVRLLGKYAGGLRRRVTG